MVTSNAVRKFSDNVIRPHNRMIQILRRGRPVSATTVYLELEKIDADVKKKMPQYIQAIKNEGGRLRIYKVGHNVIAYQLLNYELYNRFGSPTKKAHELNLDHPVKGHEYIIQPAAA